MVDHLRSSSLLRSMRIILHVSFAALLLVALIRSALEVPPTKSMHTAVILPLGILLGALYFVGTFAEKRRSDRGTQVSRGIALAWLALITGLWLILLMGNPEFAWLAFPLFFIHLSVLPVAWGTGSVLVMTGAVIALQLQHSESPQVAMILGPLFGVAFAGAMTWVYRALLVDLTYQRTLVSQLSQTRAHLARTQHEAGVIAERERMAREIHDTLAQGLSSIILVSGAAQTALAAGDTTLAGQRLEVVETAARENLAQARNFVRGIAGLDLEQGGPQQTDPRQDLTTALGDRLAQLCAAAQTQMQAAGISSAVTFVAEGAPRSVPVDVAAGVVRVAQTLLGNVVAHSNADQCVLTLSTFPGAITLDIFDSGRGFTPEPFGVGTPVSPGAKGTPSTTSTPGQGLRRDGSGFGLRSAAQRIADLGGTFDLESREGRGTLVTVKIPLINLDEEGTTDQRDNP